MKILHLDSGRQMRGGQWQVLALHRGLIRRGHTSLLLARREGPLLARAAGEGLPVQELRPRHLISAGRGADIAHAHDARSHTLYALFGARRLVVSRRVAFPVGASPLSRWKYRKPALFLAVSRFVAGELRKAGVADERIQVVYDGVPLPPQTCSGDALITLHSDDPAKGMALALQAARAAGMEIHPSGDLPRDLPRARAMLYLTHSEGLGSGILLSMAHGVPVVASNVGGIPELIEDGIHGILVRNEIDDVVRALGRLTPAMGVAARRRVESEFSEDRMVAQTIRAYGYAMRANEPV